MNISSVPTFAASRRAGEADKGRVDPGRDPSPTGPSCAPTPAGVLQLQRMAGNAAVSASLAAGRASGPTGLVVQRYKSLARGATALPRAPKQHKREMFVSHAPEPVVADPTKEADWGNVTTSYPDLLASDDDTVVIQDTDKEPQEFYGTPAVVKQAQKVLGDHDSLIGLEVGGATLDTTKSLTRVKAKSNVVPVTVKATEEIETILDHICINFANIVMGLQQTARRHELVLHQTDHSAAHDRHAPITSDSLASSQVDKLAGAMAGEQGTLHKTKAASEMAVDAKVPTDTGERYGRRLAADDMDESARRLGVNEYAQPKVGEAYATYSVKTEDGVHKDFSKLVQNAPTVRKSIWGYHFAGVVAESEDGKDKVTLENYNRSGDIYEAFIARLVTDFGAPIANRAEAASKSNRPATDLADLYAELVGGTKAEKEESADRFKAALTKSFSDALRAWFFRMYGTKVGSGQTFHEKNAASGYFANPLTVRVGAPGGTAYGEGKSRRFAQLAGVALQAPLDYQETESRVRPRHRSNMERVVLSDYIIEAPDEPESRSRLKEGLRIMSDEQSLVHFNYVMGLARKLDISASKLPRLPHGAAAYDAAFDQIEQACVDAGGKLMVGKDKKQKLAHAQQEAAGVKAAVGGQLAYYAPFV